ENGGQRRGPRRRQSLAFGYQAGFIHRRHRHAAGRRQPEGRGNPHFPRSLARHGRGASSVGSDAEQHHDQRYGRAEGQRRGGRRDHPEVQGRREEDRSRAEHDHRDLCAGRQERTQARRQNLHRRRHQEGGRHPRSGHHLGRPRRHHAAHVRLGDERKTDADAMRQTIPKKAKHYSLVGIWKSPAERSAMNKLKTFIIATLALASLSVMSSVEAQQQQPQQAAPQLPQAPNMTFFVTSVGLGKGADLGGLEGADQYCQQLARRHGAGGKTWRAYLSIQAVDGKPAVNARDRIGNGPWQNFKGDIVAQNLDDLHSNNNKLGMNASLTERGQVIPGVGFAPNRHDVLTGSTPEGRAFPTGEDRTCRNWTSSTQGTAMLGHIDRKGLRDDEASRSWNSSHPSRGPDGGCSQADLRST